MAKSGKPELLNKADKIKNSDGKRAGVIVWICVFSVCLIFVAAGKILYDEALESAAIENAAVNRQAAAAFDIFFSSMYNASFTLLETADTGDRGALAALFFENSPYAAAVSLYDDANNKIENKAFINNSFFSVNDASPRLLDIFTELHIDTLDAARKGNKTILNGESIFGFPMLAMFFPYRGRAAIVFFYPAELKDVFNSGPRMTYCVNMDGGALIYSERAPQRDSVVFDDHHFVRNMSVNTQSGGRERYVSSEGQNMLGAYTKLQSIPAALITEVSYSAALGDLVFAAKRAVATAAFVIFLMALILMLFIKNINLSLKKLKLFESVNHKLEVVSRFANMRLARQSLEGALPDGAEYKKATVLLSEMESFNGAVERLNPKDALSLINDYNVQADVCVKKTNGCLEQLPDGAVMAHWGSLCTSGDVGHDALNAVRCALMMRVSMYELNKEIEAAGKPRLRFFCGISSGEFVDGITDCDKHSHHILMGETMVIADIAKAQNVVFDTDILISESAWRLTQKYILVQEMPPLQIEGRLKPLRIFALVNLRTKQGEAQVFPATLDDVRSLYSQTESESGIE
ncbi:MAG: adenylate/guanylate cyclase domain-containing protein [Spirochaetaceae bacterium]|jgi:adenylate cyclase|nr:adenylate/guanylate cyclase domain-containing protein [Spirochaetaceae bacterium]